MKASCLQESMHKVLQITSRVTPGRTTMPILQNTLVRTTGTGQAIEFTATNQEMTVRMRIAAEVEREGELTAPNKLLTDFIATLPHEPVTIEQVENTFIMRIQCGSAKANVNGTNGELFPPVPETGETNAAVITAEEFRRAVNRVAYCAASHEGRPVLTGVLMELEGDTLTTVGADGFRLGVQRSQLQEPAEKNVSGIVPARTLLEVQRIAGKAEREVTILIPENGKNIRFVVGSEDPSISEVEITSLLLAGTYPAYESLIPQDLPNRAVFSLSDLSQASRRAEIFARDDSHRVRFQMSGGRGGEGTAVITSEAKDLGNNRAEIRMQEMNGNEIALSLNGKYIQETLSNLSSEQVMLETSNSTAPVKMSIPDDDSYVHVMMPIVTLEDQQT